MVTGTLDWMGVAHMLGLPGTVPELAGIARLAPGEVLLFARQDDQTQPGERQAIETHGIESIMVEEVAADPRGAAARAAEHFDRYLVHFDVDVVDFADMPLSENTGHNIGLSFDVACASLEVLAAGAGFAGLTVTEHNPAARRRGRLGHRRPRRPPERRAQSELSRTASRPSGAPQSSIEAGAGIP